MPEGRHHSLIANFMLKQFYFSLAAALIHSGLWAQAPNISYTTPKSYVLGIAIPSLSPTNTGGLVTYGVTASFAGSGELGWNDGSAAATSFDRPKGVASDAEGNIYVADTYNNKIRKITPTGTVSTLAGSGIAGMADASGAVASFNLPSAVAVDAAGNVYVADTNNHKIRKITPQGAVTTLAGSGIAGSANGTGAAARFYSPQGIAVDASGNIYVADTYNNKIRKITPSREVSTLAGTGSLGYQDGYSSSSRFYSPYGVAVDASGTVYVADTYNNRIRKITPEGMVSTLAGSGTKDDADGKGKLAGFNYPKAVAIDAAGTLFVADGDNYKIRQINPEGQVSTLAGSGLKGSADGTGGAASFYSPSAVAIDAIGSVYVADTDINKIRKINYGCFTVEPALPAGLSIDIRTGAISGTPIVATPQTVYKVSARNTSGTGIFNLEIETKIEKPIFSYASPQNYEINTVIAPLSPVNTGGPIPLGTRTPLSGSGATGSADGDGALASFFDLTGAAMDDSGNIYVADYNNHKIRKIAPDGATTTFAGNGKAYFADGSAAQASFNGPIGVAVDAAGNVYVADSANHRIRKITPEGTVSTLAGSGTAGFQNGAGTGARFLFPSGLAVDARGNVYVADTNNQRIRKITPAGETNTFAGNGTVGSRDFTGISASFNYPRGIAIDASSNLYIGDVDNNRVRKINPSGRVSTLAGSSTIGDVNGTGLSALFYHPSELAVDASGTVYLADRSNAKIKKISRTGVVTTFAENQPGNPSQNYYYPSGIVVDPSNNVYVANGNNIIYKIKPSYTITPKLPEGLYLDASTGAISGMPKTAAPARTYTITATNSSGSGTFNITIGTFKKAPIISYPSPVNYAINTAIPPLSPTNAGGQITGGYTSTYAGSGSGNSTDGTADIAGFNMPRGIAVDASGNVYVADLGGNKIRKITPDGTVSTLAGNGAFGYAEGLGAEAEFKHPNAVAVDPSGNVYVADTENNMVRKITPAGVVSGFAGNGKKGSADGTGTAASFDTPFGIAADASGNIYVADTYNGAIRKITPERVVSTLPATGFNPVSIALDALGTIYVADSRNYKVKKIAPDGTVSTLAGNGTQAVVDGIGTEASFYSPSGIAIDASGTVYLSENYKNIIRKITPQGTVSTWAGNGIAGEDNGFGSAASFAAPKGVTVDASGNLYVADDENYIIRKISPAYTVTPPLPAGLQMDPTTGIITGTPIQAIAAKSYSIKATNASGTGTFDITIGTIVSDQPKITAPSNLSSSGTTATTTMLSWSASEIAGAGMSKKKDEAIITYSIYKDGMLLTSVTETSYAITGLNPSTSYSFTVSAKDSEGNVSAASHAFSVTTLAGNLGTGDFEEKNALRFYPNPTAGNITIEKGALENANLNIFDILGRVLFSKKLEGPSTIIDVSNLPIGVYMFQILSDSGTIVKKVVRK